MSRAPTRGSPASVAGGPHKPGLNETEVIPLMETFPTTTPESIMDPHAPAHGSRAASARSIAIAPRTLATLVAFFLVGVALAGFVYAIRTILAEVLAAIVLAIALEPVVQAMERRRVARPTAVFLTFLTLLGATVAFVYALVPPITEGLPRLVHDAPGFLENLKRIVPFAAWDEGHQVLDSLRAWWAEHGGARLIGEPTVRFAIGFLDTGSAAASVAFLSLFVLLSGPEWFAGFLQVVPSETRGLWRRMGDGITKAVGGYVMGNLLISVIAGTVATVVLLIAKVPYAFPLGLVVAVFDLIPMVGAALATVIVGLVALTRGIGTCSIVVGALVLYQLVENQFLTQAVYHGTVKLSVVTIAVSLAIGAQLGGVSGALMAIPVAAALKVAFEEVLAWNRR